MTHDVAAGTHHDQLRQMFGAAAGRVVGPADAAAMLGIGRAQLNRLALDDASFPTSVTILGTQRYWWRSGIEIWASLHRPRRLGGHGPFGREAAAILALAEAASAELRHPGVIMEHFWLALVDPAAPGIVRDVLASVAVDRSEVLSALVRSLPPGDQEGYAPSRRMSPHVQRVMSEAAPRAVELTGGVVGASAIALALLEDWPSTHRDRFRSGGGPVSNWLHRRGLDREMLRERIVNRTQDRGRLDSLEFRRLPKRRPARSGRHPGDLPDLAPNPLGHDPRERYPWGSTFARRSDGRSWVEGGRRYFFFYDRDRFRIRTTDDRPVGYWWQVEPRPPHGGAPKRSRGAVVLPPPPNDVEWPERLPAWRRPLVVRRSAR